MTNRQAPPAPLLLQQPPTQAPFTAFWIADPPSWAVGQSDSQQKPDQPLLVVRGSRILGCNMAARSLGLQPGQPLARALQLFPGVQVRSFEATQLSAALEEAARLAYTYSPRVELDPAGWLWVAGLTPMQVNQLAQQLQLAAGSAPSRSSAQLAALGTPAGNGHLVENELHLVAQTPLEALQNLDFAPTLLERLRLFGLVYLGDLHRHNLSQRQLEAQFGREGRRLYQIVHGQQTQPVQVYREAEVLEGHCILEQPARDPGECQSSLAQLAQQLAQRLQNRRAWRVGLQVHTPQGLRYRYRLLGQASSEAGVLERVARRLLQELALEGSEIEALTLRLGQLERPPGSQTLLWGGQQRSQLHQAIQQIERHYPGALLRLEMRPARFREEGLVRIALGQP